MFVDRTALARLLLIVPLAFSLSWVGQAEARGRCRANKIYRPKPAKLQIPGAARQARPRLMRSRLSVRSLRAATFKPKWKRLKRRNMTLTAKDIVGRRLRPKRFRPFTLAEAVGRGKTSGSTVKTISCKTVPSSRYLAELNKLEQAANRAGYTLRKRGTVYLGKLNVDYRLMASRRAKLMRTRGMRKVSRKPNLALIRRVARQHRRVRPKLRQRLRNLVSRLSRSPSVKLPLRPKMPRGYTYSRTVKRTLTVPRVRVTRGSVHGKIQQLAAAVYGSRLNAGSKRYFIGKLKTIAKKLGYPLRRLSQAKRRYTAAQLGTALRHLDDAVKQKLRTNSKRVLGTALKTLGMRLSLKLPAPSTGSAPTPSGGSNWLTQTGTTTISSGDIHRALKVLAWKVQGTNRLRPHRDFWYGRLRHWSEMLRAGTPTLLGHGENQTPYPSTVADALRKMRSAVSRSTLPTRRKNWETAQINLLGSLIGHKPQAKVQAFQERFYSIEGDKKKFAMFVEGYIEVKADTPKKEVSVKGGLDVGGFMFDNEFHLLGVHGDAHATDTKPHAKFTLKLFGNDVWAPEHNGEIEAWKSELFKVSAEVTVKINFVAGFIPMAIVVGVKGEVGVDLALSLGLPSVTLTLTPYVQVKGFLSIGVDLFIASVVIEGEILVLRLAFPIWGTIRLDLFGEKMKVVLEQGMDIELEALSGKIKLCAYLELPIIGKTGVCLDIFKWTGIKFNKTLYSVKKEIDIE